MPLNKEIIFTILIMFIALKQQQKKMYYSIIRCFFYCKKVVKSEW